MSKAGRPSEEDLFEAARQRDATPIVTWISSPDISVEDGADILGVLRRASSLIMARSTAKKDAARDAFLSTVRLALVNAFGAGAGEAFDEVSKLLLHAEDGQRRILAQLALTDYAKLPADVRIWAALSRGAEQAIINRAQIGEMLDGQKSVYAQSLSLRDPSGRPVSPDAIMDAIIESASATLNLEGRSQKWVGADEVITIPAPAAVTDDDRFKAGSNEALSLAWQAWDLLQERVRFLGGRIVLSTRPDLPDGVPPEIDDLFTSVEAPDDFYTWAAQHRMNDGSAQSYLQLWNAPALNRATVGVDVGAQLPPSNVVSHEEAVACQALEQVLGYDLAADPEEIDGLRIVEWLRGLSVLSVLAARRAEVDTSNPDAWLIPFDRAELAAVLIRNGLVAQKAELFIDQARFRTSSVDLYDAPLIQSADGSLIGFGPAMVGASAAGALLSIFARKEASFDRKGKSFERRVVDLLKGQGLKVATLKTSRGGEEYDYDAMLLWDGHLFLFECKNRSLPYDKAVRVRNFVRETRKQVRQVTRLRDALDVWPDLVQQAFGEPLGDRKVVPVLLNNLPYARFGDTDGVYFYDFQALSRFFHSRALSFEMSAGGRRDTRTKIDAVRLWRGDTPTAADLLAQLENPIQLRITHNLTRGSHFNFQLDAHTIASEPRLFREDLTPENIGIAAGIPRHVMKQKARALAKKVRKKAERRKARR